MSDSNPFTLTISSASALGTRAASLQPGNSSTELGDNSGSLSSVLLYPIQWENTFYYDQARGFAYILGKDAGGGPRSTLLYNEATNTWSGANYAATEAGHIYESMAFDPATGDVYNGHWNGSTFQKVSPEVSLTAFTEATSSFSSVSRVSLQPACAWHPNLFGTGDGGLVVAGAQTDNDQIAKVVAWRKATNTWSEFTETTHTTSSGNGAMYDAGAEYCRGGDSVYVSYRAGAGGRTYRIPAGSGGVKGTAVQISNPPVDLTYPSSSGARVGALVDDPSGGSYPYILGRHGTKNVWKFNGTSWVDMGFLHPFSDPNGDYYWVVASCYPYGVFWGRGNSTGQPSKLWRPG